MSSVKRFLDVRSRAEQILLDEGLLPLLKEAALYCGRSIINHKEQYLFEEILDRNVPIPPLGLAALEVKPVYIPTMNQREYEALFSEEASRGRFYDYTSHPAAQSYIPSCIEANGKGMVILYCALDGEFVHVNSVSLSGKGTEYEFFHNRLQQPFYSIDDVQTAYRALCATNPKFRRRGVFKFAHFTMHNLMMQKGYSKFIFTVNPDEVNGLTLYDRVLYPDMNTEARYKIHVIRFFSRIKITRFRRCRVQPLDELGIPRIPQAT